MPVLLCVSSKWVEDHLSPGFTKRESASLITEMLDSGECTAVERAEAETRDDIKQLVSYATVRTANRILVYQRGKGGGEKDLYRRLSLGVGGHVERDGSTDEPSSRRHGFNYLSVSTTAFRELREELVIASPILSFHFQGFIWNHDDAVGNRHLGLAYDVLLDGQLVQTREPEAVVEPSFYSAESVRQLLYTSMERWSQIVFDERWPNEGGRHDG